MILDVEWIAFARGIKPALRVSGAPERCAAVAERARALGAVAIEAERLANIAGRSTSVLYVARERERADELRRAESPVLPGGPSRPASELVLDAHRRVGVLLGYPRCCVDAFAAVIARGVTTRAGGRGEAAEDFVVTEDADQRSRRRDWRLDVLRRKQAGALIAWYPCRLDCEPSIAIAAATLEAVRALAPEAADTLERALRAPIAITPDGRLWADEAGDLQTPPGALHLSFDDPAR